MPDSALLIVRGDALDPDVIRADAARFARRYPDLGWLGVSAYYASEDAEIDALCESRLNRFSKVIIFQRADLEAAELISIVGTFRTPHVTLAAPDLETLIRGILSCPSTTRSNRYYETDDLR